MSRSNPFRQFRTSPDFIRFAAMAYVRFRCMMSKTFCASAASRSDPILMQDDAAEAFRRLGRFRKDRGRQPAPRELGYAPDGAGVLSDRFQPVLVCEVRRL